MPIYDYACTVCGRVVEVVHGVNGHGPQACETCGGPMKKLLSTPAVHFKGSGWAKKDRGASNTTKAAARSASSGDGTSQSGDSSSQGDAAKSDTAKTETATSEAGKGEATGASTSSGSDAD
jgi:putative FmdB family regulatory protein